MIDHEVVAGHAIPTVVTGTGQGVGHPVLHGFPSTVTAGRESQDVVGRPRPVHAVPRQKCVEVAVWTAS